VQWLPSTRVGRQPDSRRIDPKTTVVREDERGVAMRAGLGDENDTLIRGVKRPKVRGDGHRPVDRGKLEGQVVVPSPSAQPVLRVDCNAAVPSRVGGRLELCA